MGEPSVAQLGEIEVGRGVAAVVDVGEQTRQRPFCFGAFAQDSAVHLPAAAGLGVAAALGDDLPAGRVSCRTRFGPEPAFMQVSFGARGGT